VSGTNAPTPPSAGGTQASDRVADVLLALLASDEPRGVSEIARSLDLPKAVVHRVLQSLCSRGLARPADDGRGYRRGPVIMALGARRLPRVLRTAALPEMARLRDETAETVTLSLAVETARMYVDQLASPARTRLTVMLGGVQPLHAGASGKAILAFLEPAQREQVLQGPLRRVTTSTIVDPQALRAELRRIARTRISLSRGERNRFAGSLASPVFGPGNQVVGAISICGPIQRVDQDAVRRAASRVVAAAHRVSTRLQAEVGQPGGVPTDR
jgi:DNA-binding IclR family transcriptional regulator